jgi:hypothetical protein
MNWTLDSAAMPAYLRVTCQGKPAIIDLESMWTDVLSYADWTPGLPVLVDVRSLDFHKDPDACTMAAIDFFAKHKIQIGDSCIALLSAGSQSFKYARQFQYGIRLRGSNVTLQIFNSDSQAIQWIENYCSLRSQQRTAAG